MKHKVGIRLCSTCPKKDKPTNSKKFKSWALGFSATVLKVVFILWAVSIVFCMGVITYALLNGGSIEEPVNFMHEINSTFGTTVVGVLVTRVVGNVFEYNDGGIFGTSIGKENSNDSTDSGIFADNMRGDDHADHRGD